MDRRDAELMNERAEFLDDVFERAERDRQPQTAEETCPKCGRRKFSIDALCATCRMQADWREKDRRNFRRRGGRK